MALWTGSQQGQMAAVCRPLELLVLTTAPGATISSSRWESRNSLADEPNCAGARALGVIEPIA